MRLTANKNPEGATPPKIRPLSRRGGADLLPGPPPFSSLRPALSSSLGPFGSAAPPLLLPRGCRARNCLPADPFSSLGVFRQGGGSSSLEPPPHHPLALSSSLGPYGNAATPLLLPRGRRISPLPALATPAPRRDSRPKRGQSHAGICDFFGVGRGFGWLWLNHRAGPFGRGGGRGDSRTNRIMGLCHLPC